MWNTSAVPWMYSEDSVTQLMERDGLEPSTPAYEAGIEVCRKGR